MALSTYKAEYVAAAVATQNTIWLGPHLAEIQGEKRRAVPIGVDNQGAIALAKKDGWNRRTRHINVRFMFIQEALQSGEIEMLYIQTDIQLADGLTKALKRELFERWRRQLVAE
jgi:hypothetical protein